MLQLLLYIHLCRRNIKKMAELFQGISYKYVNVQQEQ